MSTSECSHYPNQAVYIIIQYKLDPCILLYLLRRRIELLKSFGQTFEIIDSCGMRKRHVRLERARCHERVPVSLGQEC